MGNYEQLKEAIKAVIKTNGKQEITGQVMQDTLLAITSSFGQGALFAGIATPETNPLTPDQNVFYLAAQSGVYPNFNGLSVGEGEIVVFSLSVGQWTKQILSLGGGGSVTIINEPDEEDLTTVPQSPEKNVIRFKNRVYDETNASGKGYKILRKYWKEVNGVRKNILTQDMINDANTIYEIRYDFDLNEAEIQIKEGCVLNFVGGSLSNGSILFRNCVIKSNVVSLLFKNIIVIESDNVEEQQIANDYILADFFYDGSDIGKATNNALKLCKHVKYLRKIYTLKTPIIMSNNSMLTGMGENKINEKSGYQPKCTEIITEEDINAIECNQANSCKISNIGLYNRLELNLSRGILITNSTYITLNDITIIGFDIGIEHKGGFGCLFNKIIISNAYYGINLTPSSKSQVNGGVYTDIRCKFCNIGYKIFDCNNLTFINCSGEVIHKDYSIKGREGSQISASWNIQEGTEIILINPYLEGADTFIYQRYSNGKGQLAIISAYYNSHAGETYVKPFTDGLFGYLKNTTIIGLTITNAYYSGSGTPTHQGMIYLSDNCHVSNVVGGMATVNGDNIIITNCKFAIERFGGIWTDNKFHPNNIIQGKSNIGTNKVLNDVGNTLKSLYNNTNPGLYAFNSSLDKPSWWNGSTWINAEGFKINKNRGTTSERPSLTQEDEGFQYYDTTLKKYIVWNGTEWVGNNGYSADYITKGMTSERPTLTNADNGFEYYDNVLKKKILWNGIAWANMDGTALQ